MGTQLLTVPTLQYVYHIPDSGISSAIGDATTASHPGPSAGA